jgi:hypothetical protein
MRRINSVVVALRDFRHCVLGQGFGIDNRFLPTLCEIGTSLTHFLYYHLHFACYLEINRDHG